MLPEPEEEAERRRLMRERKTVVLPVEVLDDPRLTLSDIGLLGEILRNQFRLSKITTANLNAILKETEKTIRKGLVRLTESGYLIKDSRNNGWLIDFGKIYGNERENLPEQTVKSPETNGKISLCKKEEESTKEEDKNNKQKYIYNNIILKETENEKEREIKEREKDEPEVEDKPKLKRAVFVKPTREEVLAYCRERQSTVSSSAFYDFYESKGWMVGKNHMKDWKAAVRTWEQKDKQSGRYYVPAENRTDGSDDLPY